MEEKEVNGHQIQKTHCTGKTLFVNVYRPGHQEIILNQNKPQ